MTPYAKRLLIGHERALAGLLARMEPGGIGYDNIASRLEGVRAIIGVQPVAVVLPPAPPVPPRRSLLKPNPKIKLRKT